MSRNKLSHRYSNRRHRNFHSRQTSHSPATSRPSFYEQSFVHSDLSRNSILNSDSYSCSYCQESFPTRILYQKHLNNNHREEGALPFICTICQKGFFSLTGLRHHMEAHKGRQFMCVVCDSKFQHKHHLKRHIEGVHNLKECRLCLGIFPMGPEFDSHILHCGQGT